MTVKHFAHQCGRGRVQKEATQQQHSAKQEGPLQDRLTWSQCNASLLKRVDSQLFVPPAAVSRNCCETVKVSTFDSFVCEPSPMIDAVSNGARPVRTEVVPDAFKSFDRSKLQRIGGLIPVLTPGNDQVVEHLPPHRLMEAIIHAVNINLAMSRADSRPEHHAIRPCSLTSWGWWTEPLESVYSVPSELPYEATRSTSQSHCREKRPVICGHNEPSRATPPRPRSRSGQRSPVLGGMIQQVLGL